MNGSWTFSKTYTHPSGGIRSVSLLISGDLLLLGGTSANFWSLQRLNTTTQAVTELRLDASLRTNVNLKISSVAVDFGGPICTFRAW